LSAKEIAMISKRQKMVLKAIVEEYVKTNEPVGSKTLTNNPQFALNVSPATIRNDMVDLEQMGLIVKTHSSSGRIPSEEGYRVYVGTMLAERENIVETFPLIDEIFDRNIISREQAIKESMSLVTDLTNYASIVLGTASYNARIKKLQFIPLTDRHAVILIVTDQGYVESKKIIIPEGMKNKEVEKVVFVMNELLHDIPIAKIDETIKKSLDEASIGTYLEYYEEIIGAFVRTFTEMVQDKYFLSGQSNILTQPEFQDIKKVKELLSAIENQEILKAVSVCENSITVRIGNENQLTAMKDCTVITIPYELDDGKCGAIAVIGPTRMEYQKVIPLLEYIAKNIKKVV